MQKAHPAIDIRQKIQSDKDRFPHEKLDTMWFLLYRLTIIQFNIGNMMWVFFIALLLSLAHSSSAYAQTSAPSDPSTKTVELRGAEKTISLMRAFDETLTRSPRAAAVRLQLGIAKSGLIRATELPNPTIFMDNGYRAEFTYRYGFAVPIEPPWKLALRIIVAKNQIKQADLEILKALWSLRATVRRVYTDFVVAKETYYTLIELANLTEKLYQITQKRFEAGEVAQLDVFRAEQEAQKTEADKQQQYYRMIESRQALSVILGRTPDEEIDVPRLPPFGPTQEASGILPSAKPDFPILAQCLSQAMIYRPELKVVRQAIRTNQANYKLAFGNIIPNPTIGVGSSVVNGPPQPISAPGESSSPAAPNNFHGFFFQVFQELPIFNLQQGDISLYRATGRQLKAELVSQENIVSFEVATAYQRLKGAKEKIEIYQNKLLKRTLEIVRLARLGYEVGQTDINATLLAQQSAIDIRTEYLSAVAAYQSAFTDLEQSMGTVLQ